MKVYESVACACQCRVYNNATTRSCPPRSYSLLIMATPTTGDASSIFRDGKVLKPGIYKVQHLYFKNYMDIDEHSRDVCCRPATDLEKGRGLVRPVQQPVAHVSDDQKWKIAPLGAGYSIQRVSVHIYFTDSPSPRLYS
jgi:hypothetical protein